jgi:hypothetical protein
VDAAQLETLGNGIASAIRELDMGTATLTGMKSGAAAANKAEAAGTAQQAAPESDPSPNPSAAAGARAPLPGQAVLGDERVRSVLTRLLGELRREPKLSGAVAEIDRELGVSLTAEQLPQVIERVGGLIVQRIQGLERTRENCSRCWTRWWPSWRCCRAMSPAMTLKKTSARRATTR